MQIWLDQSLEKEVGGFRFVAEVFGVELKNVVKFFIFLIVIVFDPLAVALIIAFNGLIETKKQKQSRLLGEMMENDQKLGLYEVYGDTKENIVENISQNIEDSGKNSPIEEKLPNLIWEEFMHPDYPWNNKKLWINNPKAVQYWLNSKKGTVRELNRMKNDIENIKTY